LVDGDDITRDAVARVLETPLDVDGQIVERIRDRFARRGMTMPEINRRQADGAARRHGARKPQRDGARLVAGAGQDRGGAAAGPPREMTPMLESVIRERLAPKMGGSGLFRRVLKITGRAESRCRCAGAADLQQVDRAGRADQHDDSGRPRSDRTAPDGAAANRIESGRSARAGRSRASGRPGPAVYSTDGRPLEVVLGDLLRERKLTIAVAESCTGGLLTSRLTDVPGSSEYVERGRGVL